MNGEFIPLLKELHETLYRLEGETKERLQVIRQMRRDVKSTYTKMKRMEQNRRAGLGRPLELQHKFNSLPIEERAKFIEENF